MHPTTKALWATIGGDTVPTRAEVERAIKKLYRFGLGTRFDGTIKFSRGDTWSYQHGEDPDIFVGTRCSWSDVVMMMSRIVACIYYREQALPGEGKLDKMELKLVREVIKRGWMGGKLADIVVTRTPEQAAIERYEAKVKALNKRLAAWQAKHKRAANAMRKINAQLKRTHYNHAKRKAKP